MTRIRNIVTVAAIVAWTALIGNMLYQRRTHWTVEPVLVGDSDTTADWKWRSCLTEWPGSKGCGSPGTYDEALWWSTTEGGKKVAERWPKQ